MKRKKLRVRTAIIMVADRIITMGPGEGLHPLDRLSYIDQMMKTYLFCGEFPLCLSYMWINMSCDSHHSRNMSLLLFPIYNSSVSLKQSDRIFLQVSIGVVIRFLLYDILPCVLFLGRHDSFMFKQIIVST
jgi:hypothetical protein